MDAVNATQGTMNAMELNAERTVRTVKMVKDAVEMEGEMALKLLESALVDPYLGRHLDLQA